MTIATSHLYDRMLANFVGAWRQIAEGTAGASIERLPGATAGVFPAGPERLFYNNAVLDRNLSDSEVGRALEATIRTYATQGVGRYAIWAHESEDEAIAGLAGRGFHIDTRTRAMAMPLTEIRMPLPDIELVPADWGEYLRFLRILDAPPGLLAGVDPSDFHVLVARLDGETVTAGIAYDQAGDCGIYNLGTLPHARRRGLGTAITLLHLYEARERGCETASLQSTEEAESIYSAIGFRDLGQFVEYVP
jgi:ribosomal protein S18 acetylase RimI-like enzyme